MIYRFANCLLDGRLRELTTAGDIVHLEPQVLDVLLYLIENRDRVVTRDDLIDAVWEGRIVSDATIGARIFAARHAVGDTGARQAVIRTLPRRGFRFVAPVALDAAGVPASPPAGGIDGPGRDVSSRRRRPRLLRAVVLAAGALLMIAGARAASRRRPGE